MAAKPLTAAEKAWLQQLQDLINKCPTKRMAAFTTGDNDITLYDKSFNTQIDSIMDSTNADFCGAVQECDASLGNIKFPFQIHSTSG